MSAACYLLVRFDKRERLPEAAEAVAGDDRVVKWDAVDGWFSLVLKLKDEGQSLVDKLRGFEGYASVARCDLVADNENGVSADPEKSQSYVFVETAKGSRDRVMTLLTSMDKILFVSPTTGSYDLVAMAEAERLDDIDRLVADEISSMDDVLRVKQDRVVYLDRL